MELPAAVDLRDHLDDLLGCSVIQPFMKGGNSPCLSLRLDVDYDMCTHSIFIIIIIFFIIFYSAIPRRANSTCLFTYMYIIYTV